MPTYTRTYTKNFAAGQDTVKEALIGLDTDLTGVFAAANTLDTGKAPLASPTFTGTPAAPTAALGTSTTQLATTAFVAGTAMSATLPAQTGNANKLVTTDGTNASWTAVKTVGGTTILGSGDIPTLPDQTGHTGQYLKSNGTTADWADAKIANTVTATTATTLTSTPTLLSITPASYGVTVTLPDATTCTEGGPLHIIDNKGAYPVRVVNFASTLLGFVYGGVVSHISLVDNSTAAGVWTVENSELSGCAAKSTYAEAGAASSINQVVALDSDREFLLCNGTSSYSYGVIYRKSDKTFGTVVTIRAAATTNSHTAIKSATDQILVVSTVSDAMEVVTLSISGVAITVNTPLAITLSAALGVALLPAGASLVQVGSYFVIGYIVSGPVAQIRSIYISGTTCYISSAEALTGTAGCYILPADSTHVIATSSATTHIYIKPYLVSGTTSPALTAGSGADYTAVGALTISRFVQMGSYWGLVYFDAGAATGMGGGFITFVATGNGTTTFSGISLALGTFDNICDAIVVGTNKIVVRNVNTSNQYNTLTNIGGTANVGTKMQTSLYPFGVFLYADGTDVYVMDADSQIQVYKLDCSGANPVVTAKLSQALSTHFASLNATIAPFSRGTMGLYGTNYARSYGASAGATTYFHYELYKGVLTRKVLLPDEAMAVGTRGATDNVKWSMNYGFIKVECIP